METTKPENNNCGCENGECCPPKRKPKWMRIISVLVLLVALSIIFFKVFTDNSAGKEDQKCGAAKSSCCDTTSVNDSAAKPCCPKK
jgi:hypothetical protein